MKSMGLFEAKTKFSELCAQVAAQRQPVVVTRRGKPMVRIEPLPLRDRRRISLRVLRAQYIKRFGPLEDFELPAREPADFRDPLGN